MFSIEVRGVNEIKQMLVEFAGEIENVNKFAQNKMAKELRIAEQDQMQKDLDRPTSFTINSIFYKQYGIDAVGAPDTPGAAVYFKTPFGPDGLQEHEWLGVQSLGGQTSGPRSTEKMLIAAGLISPGVVWIPGPKTALDRFGNVRGMAVKKVIDECVNPPPKNQRVAVAIGKPPNVKAILVKIGDEWYPFLFFVPRAEYSPRFDFYGRAEREFNARFGDIWGEYLDKALEHIK